MNQLCLLVNILLIGRLVEDKRSAQLSCEPGFWMLVTPVGFFFSVYYTKSLFLLFSLLLVIAYRRNWIVWACLAGVLVGLTRPAALCLPTLFLPDMISRLRRGGPWLETLACAAAPLAGLGIYVSYVGWRVGDPLAYVHLQEIWWKHTWTLPFEPLLADLRLLPMKLMGDYRFPPDQWVRLLSSVSILGLTAWGWRKIDPAFLTYLVAGMVYIHSQEPSGANVRYELALFPVFLLLSRLMAGRPGLPGLWPASASPPRFSISIDTPLGSGWPSTILRAGKPRLVRLAPTALKHEFTGVTRPAICL